MKRHYKIIVEVLETLGEARNENPCYKIRRDEDNEIVLTPHDKTPGEPVYTSARDIQLIKILDALGYDCSVYDGEIQVGGSADE